MSVREEGLRQRNQGFFPWAPNQPSQRGSKASCSNKVRESRVRPRHRGFGERLKSVRRVAEDLPLQGRDYAYARARVGPDLKVWAVPQDGEAQLSRMGLSLPLNSQNRSRPGINGISNHGRRQIRDSCRLMEDFRRKCVMWTVTLTDDDYLDLSIACKWPQFQRRVHDLLVRYLKAHGDSAIVIGCVEVGGKRFSRTGRPDPHIHVVCSGYGRRKPDGQWLLNPDAMDELVAKACQYAGLPSRPRPSASSFAQVRSSISSYMSKYMTKDLPVKPEALPKDWQELIPRQWWFQSEACKAMVEGVLIKLPPAFASFLVRKQKLLEQLELGRGGMRTVGWKKTKLVDVAIECFCFRFKTPESLHSAIELFALWINNQEVLDVRGLVMSG